MHCLWIEKEAQYPIGNSYGLEAVAAAPIEIPHKNGEKTRNFPSERGGDYRGGADISHAFKTPEGSADTRDD